MALGPGSIAFTGYNADGADNLAFVVLEPIVSGTVIHFTDNGWNGAAFVPFITDESTWSWTATSDIAAGTVVTMDGLAAGQTATSNLGAIAYSDEGTRDIATTGEAVYAYVGDATAPVFIGAIASRNFSGSFNNSLTNTGLVEGQTAIALQSLESDADIATYAGVRGAVSFDALLPMINNPANWIAQDTNASDENDGTPPDVPFSTEPFVGEPDFQTIGFAAGSLTVSQVEGDSGETEFTFTVERSGGTTGAIDFSGTIEKGVGTTYADDFAGPMSFTDTIEDGQLSGTVTVRVQGDTNFEPDDNFTLTLRSASNNAVGTVVGEEAVAMGTVVNDDIAPVKIAFVGYNADGTDGLAFLAVSDIAAGTVIHLTNNRWNGSEFEGEPNALSWTADADVAAGTVVTLEGLNGGNAVSNFGTIALTSPGGVDFRADLAELIYAYLGTVEEPTGFLTALSSSQNSGFGTRLAGTGLTPGMDAMILPSGSFSPSADISYYNGPRTGQMSYEDYLPSIYDPANWITQDDGFVDRGDESADGIWPDAPFRALPFSVDPTAQIVQFAADSLSVAQNEGETGEAAFTFTVERTNGTDGDLTFTVRVPGGTYANAAGAADFVGDTLPLVMTGTIPDGESSVTVTILVKGEHLYEVDERFSLVLESASNPDASSVVIGNDSFAVVTILNDDAQPGRVLAGDYHTAPIELTEDIHFVIGEGGRTNAIIWSGEREIVIDNGGETGSIMGEEDTSGGSIVINNLATGIIRGIVSAEDAELTGYTLNNAGLIELSGDRMDLRDPADEGATVVVNNLAGGVIVQTSAGEDIIRPGTNGMINNHGTIKHAEGIAGGSSDGIDYQGEPGIVNNYAGGLIEASRHAVTGDAPVALFNEGTMIGRNGSAINIDSNGSEAERVFITNRGRMEGRSANLADSDGDAVDIDGLLTLENYGFIGGMGHNGYHDGEPNVSEAIAIGGGIIINHADGEIYGYGRAIQVDNSSNSNALGKTTIVNHGLIHGDGNLPTDVTPAEVEQFAERIRGGEAINLLGNYADEIVNTGQIIGGVKMGGGDDLLVNKGVMISTGGTAANLGDGDDTFEYHVGSTVTGVIDGGEGDDTLRLIGPGIGALGDHVNFENLDVQSGMWTLVSDAYESVNVATGATVMSQLRLADQGEMSVAAGGIVLVTNGSNAVVAEGAASIENTGLIQALAIQGTTPAAAIVTNGGEVHNKAGGFILAQGAAIASGEAAAAGLDIVNDGMIQSLSGQAIALGDQDDTVTNKGVITGSVDLGAGDDTLKVHTGSSLSGAMEGGEGDDTVNLIGATAASVGTFGATTGLENLVVQEGIWSVAGSASYDAITVEDGARVTSQIVVDNNDHLVIEAGGALDVAGDAIYWEGQGDSGEVVIDNAGMVQAAGRILDTQVNSSGNFTFNNLEGGVVRGSVNPRQEVRPESVITFNNAGVFEDDGRVFYFKELTKDGAQAFINNLEGGVIRQIGGDGEEDVILLDDNTVVNNWGTIVSEEGSVGGGDAVNFDSGRGSSLHNYAGGLIEGSRHAVTGKQDFIVINEGTMIGRNGSAVNFDTNEEELVSITNYGIMEGRSAELSDSDGDAVDVDGLVYLLNYGAISGLGAEGYHDGEPNVSEGLAVGGGTILNYGADAVIYGYGRAIQVDNSSNQNALGKTFINNDGLIQGDGHGPEGVNPEDAAEFDLRGNEAINLVGDHDDEILNQSTGRIVGGISMGGGNDRLQNNGGSITATGGSAIDMGAGDDWVWLYPLGTVTGKILLGSGNDFLSSSTNGGFDVDAGDGDDQIYMSWNIYGGDDILDGGAGNDTIYGGLGEDRIDGGADNDRLFGEAGDDLIFGGQGDDYIDGGDDDDVIFGDAGNDIIIGGLGNDVIKGNDGDDTVIITKLADGRDSYDGGDGVDTLDYSAVNVAVNLTLRDNASSTFSTDTIENFENVIGGSAADRLVGNSLANVLVGNAGDDTLNGGAGDDVLDGGEGNDTLNGGADNDQLFGGAGNDVLNGAAGDDLLDGGEGDDELVGGAGNDQLFGGAGNDQLNGGAGDDRLGGGEGDDELVGGAGMDVIIGGAGDDTLTGGAGADQFVFAGVGDGIDTITDFNKSSGTNGDQLVFLASMFENFEPNFDDLDVFNLIGQQYLTAQFDQNTGRSSIQIDLDGGGDDFVTIAMVDGQLTAGVLADHTMLVDFIA